MVRPGFSLRCLLVGILAWGSLLTGVAAQCPGQNTPLVPLADEQLTISTNVVALTTAIYQQSSGVAALAIVQPTVQPVTYRMSGVPTLTLGHIVQAGQTFPICGIDSIRAFRVIAGASPATLTVFYYRPKSP
jgi:hypothetical protein